MHRTYAENTDLTSDQISITNHEEIHHLRDVLRINIGDQITIFNGNGEEADAEILSIQKDIIRTRSLTYRRTNTSTRHVILACAIPKRSKFELIVEKATELGVDEIIPLNTERTEFHFTNDRADRKHERYRAVAISAAKQCQRLTVPNIHPITSFQDVFDLAGPATTIFIPCLIGDRQSFCQAITQSAKSNMIFLIGPEGDFSNNEVEYAISKKAIPVSLGNNVLRVETAAISVLAFTQLFCHNQAPHHD
jgi:16S rRNA (uracil1498-N3)-methyltransferase